MPLCELLCPSCPLLQAGVAGAAPTLLHLVLVVAVVAAVAWTLPPLAAMAAAWGCLGRVLLVLPAPPAALLVRQAALQLPCMAGVRLVQWGHSPQHAPVAAVPAGEETGSGPDCRLHQDDACMCQGCLQSAFGLEVHGHKRPWGVNSCLQRLPTAGPTPPGHTATICCCCFCCCCLLLLLLPGSSGAPTGHSPAPM
jgi:hypothetical protein